MRTKPNRTTKIMAKTAAIALLLTSTLATAPAANAETITDTNAVVEKALTKQYGEAGSGYDNPNVVTNAGGVTDSTAGITLALPTTNSWQSKASKLGTDFAAANNGTSFVAQETTSGFRILAVLANSAANHEITYTLTGQTTGVKLVSQTDGGVSVYRDEALIANIATPWAIDANGINVTTYYKLEGASLVQVIEPTATTAYPIVADPSWDTVWTCVKAIAGVAIFLSARGINVPAAFLRAAPPLLADVLKHIDIVSTAEEALECLTGLWNDARNLEESRDAKRVQAAALDREIGQNQADVNRLQASIGDETRAISTNNAQIETYRSLLATPGLSLALKRVYMATIRSLLDSNSSANERISDSTRSINSLNSSIRELQAAKAQLANEVSAITNQLNAVFW